MKGKSILGQGAKEIGGRGERNMGVLRKHPQKVLVSKTGYPVGATSVFSLDSF